MLSCQHSLNPFNLGCKAKSESSFVGFSIKIPFLIFSKRLSPITGTAQRPSIPPLSIITIKFFFLDVEAKTGKLNPAKNKEVAVPFKKSLLDIFMLLIPPVS